MNISNKSPNILSVDYEDWWTTNHYRDVVSKSKQVNLLEYPTMKLLDVLDRYDTKITFFTLGLIAKKHPELIKEIAKRGHEIASHGFSHTRLQDLTSKQFELEIKETNKILEDIIQKKVIGFRAPFFSLTQETSWAIDILQQEGFLYDSSIFPMKTPQYGVANAPLHPYYIHACDIRKAFSSGKIIELPVPVYKSGVVTLPCSGGIYGRLLPYNILAHLLDRIHVKGPIIFYFHPWELMNKKRLVPYPGFKKHFLANYQSDNYINKLEKLIKRFEFTTAESFIKDFSVSH